MQCGTNYGARQYQVLLIEDNLCDIRLVEEAFKESDVPAQLIVARDGDEASTMLFADKNAQSLPDLILMDLNMPRKSGQELLVELKSHPRLRYIPVVVFTSSSADSDVVTAYKHRANSYIVKPIQLADFFELIQRMMHFWLNVVQLPPRPASAHFVTC